MRRGDTLIVESYGEEQVVIMDVLDYRLTFVTLAKCPQRASPTRPK